MVPQAKASVAQSEMRHAALRITGLSVIEDIPHASQGSNQWLLPAAIDFAAQTIDMDIDNVRVGLNPHAPDLIENHRAGDDPARIAAKILEQNKLLWGE